MMHSSGFSSLLPVTSSREPFFEGELELAVSRARAALIRLQASDSHWCFELEADCTIPAEYILMMHYMDEIDEELQTKIAVYLRNRQCDDGGWNLYCGGDFDLSCSVKAYYALKLVGDSPNAAHMIKAREVILAHGGAASSNVFTRITLALFGQVPWRAVPFIPVEIMLLPRWFPFHLSKVSYWSRTVMVPLFILCTLKPHAKNPNQVHVRELFTSPPEREKNYFPIRSSTNRLFLLLDQVGRLLELFIPRSVRQRAVKKAENWFIERLNGTDGLGGIFPAMVNALEALALLGYGSAHPYRVAAKQALEKLLVIGEDSAYCQPCLSPVWDTCLAGSTLLEATGGKPTHELLHALDWLKERQLFDEPGDWQERRPDLAGGGWAFEYGNPHYPDLDDTAVIGWLMHRTDKQRYGYSVHRAADWIAGMQSKNGGFGSFDADNTHYYLNEIPFADHGALLDPPTSDLTARCVMLMARMDPVRYRDEIAAGLDFLRSEQESNGSWFGRWGTNYIYGTWSVLVALEAAGESPDQPYIRRAVKWLKSLQRPDGGWGEACCTYSDPSLAGRGCYSTSFQTAWAMLGLMAAGEAGSPEVRRGADYLLRTQRYDGLWKDDVYTAPGFPRVFYLKYHGYDKYFPLWALARYRNLMRNNLT
ncbi:MAG: squalene--hopene cyclase [Deltaproteobacteria bacterium]|nr:MAG: squalene--hopene cyclase [Deltaproteobacteria bacterium]